MQLVRVTWLDAYSLSSGWKSVEEARKLKPVEVKSVGYVLNDAGTHLVIASSLTDDGDCDGDLVIPAAWICKIEEL